jgi:hypothetical protein
MFDNEKARMENLRPYDAAGQLIVSEYQDSSLWRIQTFLSAKQAPATAGENSRLAARLPSTR